MTVKGLREKLVEIMRQPEFIRNVATSSHVHHGKTSLADCLAARAGMIAEKVAADVEKGMLTWIDEQERRRQLTIYGANVSMIHEYEGKEYLINLVDTPGHVDFGGDVTRAMRAVDGTIVLVCGVEGIMPQTETVFRQALRERVKPVLFINKVDRVIKELKLSPEEMQARFKQIIEEVNGLIQEYADEEFRNKWLVNVAQGSVAFGSAVKHWAISLPFMQKAGVRFKDIIRLTLEGKEEELARIAPLHQVVLDMIIRHLPSPVEAIRYRLEKIWSGDLGSEIAKQMLNCDSNGRLVAITTKMVPDPHVGFVATLRLFSGKVYKGKEVWLVSLARGERLQQVAVYQGIARIPVEEVCAGNIAAVIGIPSSFTGETICEPEAVVEPFAEIKHLFEPVVTKAVEPKNPRDLPKLVDALKKIAREDPTLCVKINPETGEYLVSGLGELHLEAKVERKLEEEGLEVTMSPPVVVYRESISTPSPVVEGKSPNKHNKLYVCVKPLEDGVYQAMLEGKLPNQARLKRKKPSLIKQFIDAGMPREEAKNVTLVHNRNVFIDLTRGVQYLNEVMEMVEDAFVEVMEEGPLARESCTKVKVELVDASLHEDPVHRGPAQIMPATRYAIREAMMQANPILLEPKQIIRIDVPVELLGVAIKEVEGRRGQVLEISEERGTNVVLAKMPVSEMFGFDASLKSATGGRGFYSLVEIIFERLPAELRDHVIRSIRKRKGLEEEF